MRPPYWDGAGFSNDEGAMDQMRIGIVAPSTPIERRLADRATGIAAAAFPGIELFFHPQCFFIHGHFAGDDATRADAFVEVANDPALDAIWFARGGYGSNRVADDILARLKSPAKAKAYLGYSDAGFLMAALYGAGYKQLYHGPMVQDLARRDGEAAILRALAWLTEKDRSTLEPNCARGEKAAAFNITVLSHLLGTDLEPPLAGHVLMLEEVSEHLYRIDRSLFHILSTPTVRRVAGIRLGRCSDVPVNDRHFGSTEEEIIRHWCERFDIPYLGRADIGHDSANKVVPFG